MYIVDVELTIASSVREKIDLRVKSIHRKYFGVLAVDKNTAAWAADKLCNEDQKMYYAP